MSEFQSLIGSLKIANPVDVTEGVDLFQSLIGSLKIGCSSIVSASFIGFNPS